MGVFGLSPFGGIGGVLDPGGFGTLPPTYAMAVGTNTVRVFLPFQPLYASESVPGDAKNLNTWTVENVPTGFDFTVTRVDQVTPVALDIHVLEAFSSRFVLHEVFATGLLLSAGGTFVPQPDLFFPGVLPAVAPTPFAPSLSDIANPQTPTDVGIAGTWVQASGGDYVNVSGEALVRKLIMRRISTPYGSFYHLPTYGCAVDPKQVLRTQDLRQVKRSMEQQILEEPEVEAIQVGIELTATNILNIVFAARLRQTGQTVTGSYKTNLATGSVVL